MAGHVLQWFRGRRCRRSVLRGDRHGYRRFNSDPSSANGVVGLKPTYGRVSRYGVLAMAESLDHVGPMARRVSDAALMFDAIAGHDTKDPTSLPDPPDGVLPQLREGVRDMRIGIDRDYALKGIDVGQAAAIESALRVLRDRGAQIIQVKMPDVSHVVDIWQPICAHEMAKAHAATFPARASEYGPYLREFLESGPESHRRSARNRAPGTKGAHQRVGRAARFGRRDGKSRRRRSRVADHACNPSRAIACLSRGVVGCCAEVR